MRKHRGLVAQIFDLFAQDLQVHGDFLVVPIDSYDGVDAWRFAGGDLSFFSSAVGRADVRFRLTLLHRDGSVEFVVPGEVSVGVDHTE